MFDFFSWSVLLLGSIFVVGVTEYIKKNVMEGVPFLEKIVPLVPLVLSFGAGFLMTIIPSGFQFWRFLFLSLVTLGFSTMGYQAIVKLVNKKVEEMDKKISQE